MMDAVIKEKWLKALRSGEYAQGVNFMKRGNRYCCLGVLADICGIPQVQKHGTLDEVSFGFPVDSSDPTLGRAYTTGTPTKYWAESIGLNLQAMEILTGMNDARDRYAGSQQSFAAIADYIEENL